ncbi:histidine phosphatase family protein [Sphingomonas sp. Leaf17]|uniref:histidine phosphatase family protein n=1 Tax=Sphingomonas sp. Leaf17 TaxID=1735683 RepID=UPI000A888D15|nr:histidine phosphatase family protein [Sphingomonas sp. Leaf17]
MMARIFVVRHGNTFGPGETARRVGAATDLPLVDSGIRQAGALGAWFAGQGIAFGRVLCSPLLRTRQTAACIVAPMAAPPPIEHTDWLREIDHGPDENQPEDVVIARIGEAALHAWDTHGIAPDGWTVDTDRRIAAWRTFLATPPAGDTLLVTSNGAARFALLAQPGLSQDREGGLKIRTGAYGVLEQGDNGVLRITDWDRRPG